jgi:hypothetical protein
MMYRTPFLIRVVNPVQLFTCPSGHLYKHVTVPSPRYIPRHNILQKRLLLVNRGSTIFLYC